MILRVPSATSEHKPIEALKRSKTKATALSEIRSILESANTCGGTQTTRLIAIKKMRARTNRARKIQFIISSTMAYGKITPGFFAC